MSNEEPKSETPLTDSLSTFLVVQFPATLGNIELNQRLIALGQIETRLHAAEMERKKTNAWYCDEQDARLKLEQRCKELEKELAQWRSTHGLGKSVCGKCHENPCRCDVLAKMPRFDAPENQQPVKEQE